MVLATEGTYPFDGGGVATWCHQLCEGLGDDAEFTILAATGGTRVAWQYDRPEAVRHVVHVPLWPGEDPALFLRPGRHATALRRRWRTPSPAVEREFVPALRVVLREVFLGGVAVDELVNAWVAMGVFLWRHDYRTTLLSESAWRAMLDAAELFAESEAGRAAPPPTLADVTTCARWLYNMLMPLGVRAEDATVFHASVASPSALPGVVARCTGGASLLLTEHGVYLRERYIALADSPMGQLQKRLLVGIAIAASRACYAVADVVAPVTAYNARWELPWGTSPDRLRVVYNGVDTERFCPTSRPPGADARPTAVAAARVFPLKDLETMIRATEVARRRLPDVRVRVYGSTTADPPYTARCRALIASLGLGDHFVLAGFHPRPHELFCEGDISVLSSISEGFPYTVLESMACGVPCVATDVGGVREAIGDAGVVVRPRDPEALGVAMAELLADDRRRAVLATRARARVVERFTLRRQIQTYRALYEELHATALTRLARGAA